MLALPLHPFDLSRFFVIPRWVSLIVARGPCLWRWLSWHKAGLFPTEKHKLTFPEGLIMSSRRGSSSTDELPEKGAHTAYHDPIQMVGSYEGKPTEEELKSLRRVPGKIPTVAYMLCIVEFCERASYYGVTGVISNFINRPLPEGGNGYGAPPRGTQETAGALDMGTSVSNAVNQSFKMLVYALPLIFGWLADCKTGRWKMICWGIAICGISHVLMVGSAAPSLLANGTAKAPFFISLYILAPGAGMSNLFITSMLRILTTSQPCSSPTSLRSFSIK